MLIVLAVIAFLIFTALASRQLTFTRQWVNPMTVFNIPHAFLLICYLLTLSSGTITFQIGSTALILLAAGYISFNAGVFLVATVSNVTTRASKPTPPSIDSISVNRVLFVSYFLFFALALSIAYKSLVLVQQYGVFYTQIAIVRNDFYTGKFDFSAAQAVAYVSTHFLAINLGIVIGCGQKIKRRFLLASLLLALANDASNGGGILTFSCLMLFFISWAVAKDRLCPIRFSFKFLGRALLFGAGLAAVIFSLLFFRSDGVIGGITSPYDIITTYAGGDIASFGYFVDNPYPSSPAGRSTFGGLYSTADAVLSFFGASFLSIPESADYVADIGYNNSLSANVGFNTSIYMAHLFADFGGAGVVVLSFLLGMAAMWTMTRSRQVFQIVRLQYFALMLFACFISIRHVLTEGKFFWLLLLAFPAINRLSKSRRKVRCAAPTLPDPISPSRPIR